MSESTLRDFLSACAADAPLELEVQESAGPRIGQWSLPQPFALVGRDFKSDVVLTDDRVSKRHAYLQVIDGALYAIDLESRAGLTWDGLMRPSGWLDPGQWLGVGPYLLRPGCPVDEGRPPGPERPNPLAQQPGPDLGWPLVRLALPSAAPTGGMSRFRVSRVLTLLGRAADCRLRLLDEEISRYHAALVRTPSSVWVVDLLSRGGLTINGTRVRWARLTDGDTLKLGRFRLTVDAAGADPGVPEPAGTSERLILEAKVNLPRPRDSRAMVPVGPRPLPARRAPAAVPAPIETSDTPTGVVHAVVAILEPLIQQLGSMQQQMFDQHQQALGLIYQMAGALHRDPSGQAQKELERIRQISQELQTLQREITQSLRPEDTAAAVVDHAPPAWNAPAASGAAHAAPPVAPSAPPAAAYPPITTAAPGPAARPQAAAATIHDEIYSRIEALQNERQGRWQRLVQLVTRAPSPAPEP